MVGRASLVIADQQAKDHQEHHLEEEQKTWEKKLLHYAQELVSHILLQVQTAIFGCGIFSVPNPWLAELTLEVFCVGFQNTFPFLLSSHALRLC